MGMRTQGTEQEKIFASSPIDKNILLLEKEVLSKMYKEHLKLNNKKMNNLILKIGRIPELYQRTHTDEKHKERFSASFVLGKEPTRTAMRHNYTPL